MPQPGLHLLIARDTLARWETRTDEAPFDVHDPRLRNGFLHGALGPDMGFFPRGPRWLSERVHGERSGVLVRMLLEYAQTPVQIAYTWGWLTHVLADVVLHPVVNGAANRLADPAHDYSLWLVAHVRVEVGLDARVMRGTRLDALRLNDAFNTVSIRFLAAALSDVYDGGVAPGGLLRAHRNMTRFTNLCVPFVTAIGASARVERHGSHWATAVRGAIGGLAGVRSPIRGFVDPIMPDAAFMRQVHAGRERFAAMYRSQVATRARELPDYDLNNGSIQRTETHERGAPLHAAILLPA